VDAVADYAGHLLRLHPIGLFVIASAFALTGIYVSKANSKYDRLIRRIVEG
jgi:uncharacterized membrane protein (DUF485 family)